MQRSVSNGQGHIRIGDGVIGRRWIGQTSVLFRKTVTPIKYGFFIIKTNSRSMPARIFEVNQEMAVYFRRYGDALWVLSWGQSCFSMEQLIQMFILLFFVQISFHTSMQS